MKFKIPVPITADFYNAKEFEQEWLAMASPGTEVKVTLQKKGAETIECLYDVAMSTPWLLEEIRTAEAEGFDAVIISCGADPGLYAAREVCNIPVVGLTETAFLLAAGLGHRFALIELIEQGLGLDRMLLLLYGMERFHACTRLLNLDVKTIMTDKKKLTEATIREARKAVEEDGADVIVLSCGGMAGIAGEVQEAVGVPVIDPFGAVIKYAEMLVSLNLSHSKKAYPTPPQKRIVI